MTTNNQTNFPADAAVAGKLVEAQAESERKRLDRGMLGILFGTKDHVPNNVAALVCIICLIAVCLILYATGTFAEKKDALAFISGLLTLSMGFLFGRATKD